MKIHTDLKLRFDSPFWASYPEFALFDVILTKKPELIEIVSKDVLSGIKDSKFGRKDSPTVEQVLRAAIYKEVKKLDYRGLAIDIIDSRICGVFLQLEEGQTLSYSVLQKYISKIKQANIDKIIHKINEIAIEEGIETAKTIGTDTTTVETDIHYPTNNSLVYDCIKTASRLLKEIRKNDKDSRDKLDKMQQSAKKYNYEINNTKAEEQPDLFAPYLAILQALIKESQEVIKCKALNNKHVNKLSDIIPMLEKVYRNAEKHQLLNEKVENKDKIFSIFEPHTDILVKGKREVEFGHKVLITRGDSNLILDYDVLEGNPSDKDLLLPTLEKIKTRYGKVPESISNDGGFTSQKNIKDCQSMGIKNIVFTKVTKSLKNIAESLEVEKSLKKWRGTTEAVISNLKRGFLGKVMWAGFDKFCAKIAWSVLGYNLRVITNRILH
jgi:transposase, IS5 family